MLSGSQREVTSREADYLPDIIGCLIGNGQKRALHCLADTAHLQPDTLLNLDTVDNSDLISVFTKFSYMFYRVHTVPITTEISVTRPVFKGMAATMAGLYLVGSLLHGRGISEQALSEFQERNWEDYKSFIKSMGNPETNISEDVIGFSTRYYRAIAHNQIYPDIFGWLDSVMTPEEWKRRPQIVEKIKSLVTQRPAPVCQSRQPCNLAA